VSGPGRPLRLDALAGWLAAAIALAVGIGVWPTWRLAGPDGLEAMALAGAATLVAFVAGLAVFVPRARRDPKGIGLSFLMTSPIRIAATAILVAAAWAAARPSPTVLLLWAVVFYLAMLAGEVLWLARLLRTGDK